MENNYIHIISFQWRDLRNILPYISYTIINIPWVPGTWYLSSIEYSYHSLYISNLT